MIEFWDLKNWCWYAFKKRQEWWSKKCLQIEATPPHSPLMPKGEIMQGLKVISMESFDLRKEGRAGALFAISLATMQGSVQIEGTHSMMMITIIPGATSTTTIKGMAGPMAKEKGMRDIKEMVDPPRNQGTPGMMNPMLLTISKKSTILYRRSWLPLLRILWEIRWFIVVPQGTSPDTRKPSLIW